MQYRRVGRTDIRVSEIGFGCWTMGGPNWSSDNGQPIGWGEVNQDEILKGVGAAIDAGVTHWDNADVYGNGRAERLLAKCLRTLGVKREEVVIATKVGWFRGTASSAFEPHHVRRQCEQSLRNLETDHLDIYYFHNANFGEYLEDAAGVMRELVAEGKVRAVGQSAYDARDFEIVTPVVKPDVLQSKANLLYDEFIRPGSPLQNLMSETGATFVGFGPLGQGLLLDKFPVDRPANFDPGDHRLTDQQFDFASIRDLRPRIMKLKERFGSTTEDLASVACRFVLGHDNVCSVIPGFRNEKQARCNLRGAADSPLTEDDMAYCRMLFAE
ncbi:MAG: aldo/keto reductase [Phycisphaerales bacterium]